jgi:hypothetical protein
MSKSNSRLDAARKAYREALEAARANPSPEAWTRLLAAGKDLSSAQEPRSRGSGRRPRRAVVQEPTFDGASEVETTLE